MHNQLDKEQKENPKARKGFYARLYGKYDIYDSLQETFKDEAGKFIKKDGDIQTFIIGKQPDITSFRNFVSLDTRSREIRNRPQEIREQEQANIVIRKYRSSGGVECFISFEDASGYLYGFTRLLLPDEGFLADIA